MKRIKSLIFKTSFILMLCLFTLISFKDNKAKAANNYPTISYEVSKSSVTPGGSFDLTISIDSANTGGTAWDAISYYLYLTNPDILDIAVPEEWTFQEGFDDPKKYDTTSISSVSNENVNLNMSDDGDEDYQDVKAINLMVSGNIGYFISTTDVRVFKVIIPISISKSAETSSIRMVSDIYQSAIRLEDANGDSLDFDGMGDEVITINYGTDKTITVAAPSPNTALNTVDITSTNGEKFSYTSSNLTDLIDKEITVLAKTNK